MPLSMMGQMRLLVTEKADLFVTACRLCKVLRDQTASSAGGRQPLAEEEQKKLHRNEDAFHSDPCRKCLCAWFVFRDHSNISGTA